MTAARSSAAAPPEPDGTGRDAERATPDANATLRLFIALWPDTRVRAALVESAGQWSWNAGAARERPERLHLTLHFLGDVPRHRAPALRGELALAFRPFDLSLARPTLWPGGMAVLEPAHEVQPLVELHAALGATLRRLGLRTETRAFRPHVTLARRAAGTLAPARVAPVEWRVDGYALAASREAGTYEIVQAYPTGTAATLERSQRASGKDSLQ